MKRIAFAFLKLFLYLNLTYFLYGCLFVHACEASQEKEFSLASFEYPPFYFVKNNKVEGIAVDLAREVFDRIGVKVSFQMYQLKRALDQLKSGREDGLMILIKTPEREQYLTFTVPVASVRGYLWCADTKKCDEMENFSLDKLSSFRVGVTRGYSYGHELDNILNNLPNVAVVSRDQQNFQKLFSDRIDIFPGNEIVAKYLLRTTPSLRKEIVHSQRHFMQWTLHMGISKKSGLTDYLPQINATITRIKEEGIVEKTIKKYTE